MEGVITAFVIIFFSLSILAIVLVVPIWGIIEACSNIDRTMPSKFLWVLFFVFFWSFAGIILAFLPDTSRNYRQFALLSVPVFIISVIFLFAVGVTFGD